MAKSTEKIDNHEDIRDDEIKDELNELMEEIDLNISLSEIWEYNDEWRFIIKEEIQWEDEKGKYIEIKWNKFYDWNWDGNWEWLWYDLRNNRATGVDTLYIWCMKWKLSEWKWTEFYWLWWKYTGERKNGSMDGNGFRVFPGGTTFNWLWKEWFPITWKFEKHKNWEVHYTYEWGIDHNRDFQGKWKIIYSSWASYEGDFLDWKRNWQWKYIYPGWSFYEWGWEDWKENWYWERTVKNQWQNNWVYKWDWKDWKLDCDNWVIDYENGDCYKWTLIEWERIDHAFKHRKDLPEDKRSNTKLPEWHCILTTNWEDHKISVTNWSISEESNSFITMFWDKKPNDDRSKQRWHIRIDIKAFDNSYCLESWDLMKTEWKLDWDSYKFKSKQWKIISIKKSISFGDNAAMHVANLINFCKNFKRQHPGGDWFDYKWNTLQYDDEVQDLRTFLWDTDILDNVPRHFWWISAKELSEWLNSN